jgi:hypothetical protein
MKAWTGFSWLRVGIDDGLFCEYRSRKKPVDNTFSKMTLLHGVSFSYWYEEKITTNF